MFAFAFIALSVSLSLPCDKLSTFEVSFVHTKGKRIHANGEQRSQVEKGDAEKDLSSV